MFSITPRFCCFVFVCIPFVVPIAFLTFIKGMTCDISSGIVFSFWLQVFSFIWKIMKWIWLKLETPDNRRKRYLRHSKLVSELPEDLKSDRSYLLEFTKKKKPQKFLEQLNEEIRDDKDIVILQVQSEGGCWEEVEHASDRLKKDREVAEAVIQGYEKDISGQKRSVEENLLMKFLDHFREEDRDLMMKILHIQPLEYRNMSEAMKNDREVTLLAIKKTPENWGYASENLKADFEFARTCLKETNSSVYECFGRSLKSDSEIILLASDIEPETIHLIPNNRFSEETIRKAFEHIVERKYEERERMVQITEEYVLLNLIEKKRYLYPLIEKNFTAGMKDDEFFFSFILEQDLDPNFGHVMKFASPRVRCNVELMVKSCHLNSQYLQRKKNVEESGFRDMILRTVKTKKEMADDSDNDSDSDEEPISIRGLVDRNINDIEEQITVLLGSVGGEKRFIWEDDPLIESPLNYFHWEDFGVDDDEDGFLLQCLRLNGLGIKNVPERYKNERKYVFEALKQNGYAINFIRRDFFYPPPGDEENDYDLEMLLELYKFCGLDELIERHEEYHKNKKKKEKEESEESDDDDDEEELSIPLEKIDGIMDGLETMCKENKLESSRRELRSLKRFVKKQLENVLDRKECLGLLEVLKEFAHANSLLHSKYWRRTLRKIRGVEVEMEEEEEKKAIEELEKLLKEEMEEEEGEFDLDSFATEEFREWIGKYGRGDTDDNIHTPLDVKEDGGEIFDELIPLMNKLNDVMRKDPAKRVMRKLEELEKDEEMNSVSFELDELKVMMELGEFGDDE